MIQHIIGNEWRLLSRERILYVALPVYLLMLAYGVVTSADYRSFLIDATSEARALADEGFESKLKKVDRILAGETFSYAEDPRLPGQLARYKGYEMATKPPSATAAISIGQSDILPSYLKVQWKPMFKQTNTDEIENPQNLSHGPFDLGFVLIYLYPLLIIALSYNALSSERESGTQVLLLSQPVSVGQFIVGKLTIRGVLVIGGAVIVSIGGLLITSPDVLQGSLWKPGALAVALVLYGLFWFGLAVLVNAAGKQSATNALIMIAAWILLVLVGPAALNMTTKALYPLPSRIEMVQALRRGEQQAQEESNFNRAYRADLLRKSEEAALAASSKDFYLKILPLEQHAEAIASPIFEEFETQRRAQQSLASRLRYLSPPAITQSVLGDLADNSAESFDDFHTQIDRFHKEWRNYFIPPVMEARLLSRQEMVKIPRFHYQPEATETVLSRVMKGMLALAVFAGAAFAGGFASLRRYSAAAR